jgi:hypothetical protein
LAQRAGVDSASPLPISFIGFEGRGKQTPQQCSQLSHVGATDEKGHETGSQKSDSALGSTSGVVLDNDRLLLSPPLERVESASVTTQRVRLCEQGPTERSDTPSLATHSRRLGSCLARADRISARHIFKGEGARADLPPRGSSAAMAGLVVLTATIPAWRALAHRIARSMSLVKTAASGLYRSAELG